MINKKIELGINSAKTEANGANKMKSLYGTAVIIPERVCQMVTQEFTPWQEFKFWLRDTMPFVGLAFLWGLYAAFMVVLFK